MKILALDTSTNVASVALLSGEILLGETFYNVRKNHSEILMVLIKELMERCETELKDLSGIVVVNGPGSFTGLRIGMSAAKGLAYVLNIPLAGVNTLDSLAWNLAGSPELVVPLLNARRGEVYTAIYEGGTERLSDYLAISLEELSVYFQEHNLSSPIFLGDGAYEYKDEIRQLFKGASIAESGRCLNRASSAAVLGKKIIVDGGGENIYTMSPFYIRESEAERKWQLSHGGGVVESV